MDDIFDLVEKYKKKKKDTRDTLPSVDLDRRKTFAERTLNIPSSRPSNTVLSEEDDDIAPTRNTVGDTGKTEEELLSGMTATQRRFHAKTGGFVDTETSWAEQTDRVNKMILEGTDTDYAETDKLLKQLQARIDGNGLSTNFGELAKEKGEDAELQGYYNALSQAKNRDILSKTKMDGQNHSVLEEMQLLTNLSGDEKKQRKEAVFKKMEELGISSKDYAFYTDDKNFSWETLGNWLGAGLSAGLNSAWLGLAKTAHYLTFQNPITQGVVDFYQGEYDASKHDLNYYKEQLGGGAGWDFGTDALEDTAGAIPGMIVTFMTMGGSTATDLSTKAAYATGTWLEKAGITAAQMLKNPNYWFSYARELGTNYEEGLAMGAPEGVAAAGATIQSLISAGIETGTDGGSGIQGLPDDLLKGDKNKFWAWVESGVEEGGEEWIQKFVGEAVTKTMYDHDADILNFDEYAREAAIGTVSGLVLGGGQSAVVSGVNAYNQYQANKLTADEKTVLDKVVEEHIAEQEKDGKKMTAKEKADYKKSVEDRLRRGYVTVEQIEKVLGGEDYANYKAESDKLKAMDDFKAYLEASEEQKRLPELEKQLKDMESNTGTVGNIKAYDALQSRIEAIKEGKTLKELEAKLAPEGNRVRNLRDAMRSKVQDRVKGTRLEESYRELARRNEKANIDVNKYTNETAKKTVQGIADSGLGDGTNEFADKVEFLANLSAKTGRVYKLMTEQQLKDAGYLEEGKETHGLVDDEGNVLLNYDSSRNLHWTIGHEVGHVVETAGHSKAMREALFNYAIAKEGTEKFNARLKQKEADYKGKKNTTPEIELANDLLGEYIFSDYEFVSNLAKTNRTVFDKAFDAIKHLYNMAVAGSTQQRELEKAKYLFQKALDEAGNGQKNTTENGGVKKAVQSNIVDTSGNVYSKVVKPGLTIYNSVKHNNTDFSNYVKEHILPRTFSVPALDGTTIKVEFAKDTDTIKKDGDKNPRKVTGELTAADNTLKKIAILNIRDLIKNSEPIAHKGENSHQWLDTNGWSDRIAYMRYADKKNGDKVYPVIIHIANARDGRHILYDVSVLKEKGSTVDMSASVLASRSDDGTSSTRENESKLAVKSIEPSDEMLAQDAPVVKENFSAPKSDNLGYHAGDLGKAEALSKQGLGRDTGHFGTGTYFVGNKADISGYNKRNGEPAPVETVDFGKYNLFKPNSAEDGFALHDFLRGVDGYWDRDADAVNTMEEYEALQEKLSELVYDIESEEFGVADPNTESWLSVEREFVSDAKRMMGDYKIGTELTSTLSKLTDKNFQYDHKNKEYYAYDFDTDRFTPYTEEDIIRMLNAEEGGWRAYENIEKMADDYYSYSRASRYEAWSDSVSKIADILGISEREVRDVFQSVTDDINASGYTDADMETADSAATRFMKALGYEGIDVRGLKGLDNTGYGSVIYDLKGEDLARKNKIGTAKFSMSSTVEQTKDLVALHNLTEEKLLKSLELGGLPMPSIAITKASIPHDNFGEITLILGKDSIDPKKNKKNVVYSADAWTPTFPMVEYEADSNVEKRINNKLLDLAKKVDDVFKHDLDMLRYGHEDNLNRHGGEEGYIKYVMDKYGVKAAYLEDQGQHIEKVTEQVLEDKKYNTANEAKYQAVADILGVSSASELGKLNLKETAEQYGEQLESIYPGITKTAMRMSSLFRQVMAYMEDTGEPVYRTVTNESAMRKAIDDSIDMEGFEAWTRELFSGIVKDKGIYNNKDLFTPSGNRKSFKQTHLPFTLENIVKAMASQNGGNTKNVSGFNGIKTLRAGTAERFKSIEAMHERKDRLQHLTQEEADKISDDLQSRLYGIMEAIDNENGNQGNSNSFIRFDSIGDNLMEIAEGGKYNIADIQKVFSQYSKTISDDLAADIKQLLFDVSEMPVNIYEAKPERAVSFDEVGVFVIPRNADIKLKQELLNRGYSIAEYDPDIEGDRNKVVNQFEEYKFSLSDAGKYDHSERGAFNERWSDFGSKDILDNFAPVAEDIATVADESTMEEIAPVVSEAASYDELIDRLEEAENLMRAAIDAGDIEAIRQYTEEFEAIREQIAEYEADDADRLASLDDADAPPERVVDSLDRADSISLGKKDITYIAATVRDTLGLSSNQMYEVHKLIEEYAQDEFASREDLFNAIKEKFGTYVESQEVDQTIKDAKKDLRKLGVYVDDIIQGDIADFADLRRRNRGKIRFSKNGTPVDVLYGDLQSDYKHLFPESIINPTNQFLRMVEVANMDSVKKTERTHDDSVLMGVANDIADYVDDIRYTQRESSAGVTGESFDDLVRNADQYMPAAEDDIAPIAESVVEAPVVEEADIAPVAEAPKAVETVESKLDAKIESTQAELDKNRQLREQSAQDYDEEIARLQAKYDSLKNKNSIAANDILRSIERKKRLKATNDAHYAKRISDLEARVEKMNSPEYRTAEHRRDKMEQYTEFWKNLIGDTSTWKDLALGISYKTKTMRRFLRQVVRGADGKANYKLADQIYNELETKYDHNEALLKRESVKLKEVFQELNLNHAEDTYAHMLGELRHNPQTTLTEEVVNEYYNKHKSKIDTNKVDTAITEARKTFDDLLVRVNTVLREQGMKEIPFRQGYFPHFTNPKQGWLAKLFNWKPVNNDIPTSIAGLTEQFEPQRSWQGFDKKRESDITDYSLYQGLDTYIHGALDWIYHIEDLQKRRSLENYIRYIHSEEGVKARIDEIKANEYYDADEAQSMIEAALAEAKNPLGNLVTELRARTNTLANKKASMDRGIEEATSRKIYSVMTNLNNRINANMVVGSFSSALTNFIPMVQSWHQVSPVYTARGMWDMLRNAVKDDGMTAKSDFLTNRLIEEEKLYQTGWDKVSNKAAFLMNVIDGITSQTVWRSKYLQNLGEGMNESQAIKDADQFAKNLMAGRSRGNAPSVFDAKNPFIKIFTAFQLEVANQYGYMFEDVVQDSKSPVRLVKGYATAFLGAYLYNALYSSLVGRDAAFDPMGIIEELLRDLGVGDDDDDDDEEVDVKGALLGLGENIAQEIPFVGSLLGGGRVPMSSAIPYNGDVVSMVEDSIDGEFQVKELLKPLYYLAMPVGGGQLKKTIEGLSMFDDDLPISGSYTDSGKLRFPVEDTIGNRIQAGLFGQYASENARYYFDNDIAPLGDKQIQEYKDVDIPIKDYWSYREGLKGKDTLGEKLAYIDSLDLPIRKQNILANNLADRKEKIDMADWDKYDGLEEFDYAKKYPEKYQFLEANGISVKQYNSFDDETKDAWSWAYKNPGKYTMSKAVTDDLVEYRQFTSDLNDITADKDANGKAISGTAKSKKLAYINSLDIDYGARLILYKSQYESDNTYNYEILEYINNIQEFTYEDRVAILEELGFTVFSDGTVQWD